MLCFPYFQGRVPAWNLAGLLPPDPTSPGPGGPSPGSSSTTLAHPLPHYSGAYGAQHPPPHYSHLLPGSTENSSSASHQWQPPNMEATTTSTSETSTTSGMHYKMDPDAAMSAMYYPHPSIGGPTSTESGSATSSSSTPVTTSAPSADSQQIHVPNFTISASTADSIGSQEMITLHQYLGSTGEMPPGIPEGKVPVI